MWHICHLWTVKEECCQFTSSQNKRYVEPISSLAYKYSANYSQNNHSSLSLSFHNTYAHSWVVRSVFLVSTVTVTSLGLEPWQPFKRSQNSSNLPYLFNSSISGWTGFAEWTNDVRWLHALTILIARSKNSISLSFCHPIHPLPPSLSPHCHS